MRAGKFTDDCLALSHRPELLDDGASAPAPGTRTSRRTPSARTCSILFDDDLQDLSLQGPLAVDYLAKHVPGIRDLKYFHHTQTTLFGKPVMISRTGYTGERGYEIFCRAEDAVEIWDTILDEGKPMGIIPASFTALDWLRVESYLRLLPLRQFADVSVRRRAARRYAVGARPGLHRLARQDGLPRRRGALQAEGPGTLQDLRRPRRHRQAHRCGGRALGRREEGRRHHLRDAFAADEPLHGHSPDGRRRRQEGTKLEVRGKNGTVPAIAHPITFDDPDKKKRTAA